MEQLLVNIDDFMYTRILIFLLAFVGIYFSIRTKFVQIRRFPDALKAVTEKKRDDGKVSSFQALMVATASRVGTGNIAGVVTAIVLGGPGALFWMWIMAIIGASSAFIESTLAQVYKERDGESFRGGPAYYIEKALKARWLGIIFAIFLIATFAFGFNGLQAFNLTSAFEYYVPNFKETWVPRIIAFLVAMGAGFLFFGGMHRISRVTSVFVPVMAGLYVLAGMIIFFVNIGKFPETLVMIVKDAFDFRSIAGGFTGSCMVYGIKRGLFSNEAGMGSAPNAAASADVSHPAKQGLVQVLSVFIDTIIICSCSAFIVLLTGNFEAEGSLNAILQIQQSVASVFGPIGIHFITVAIVLFAFTSLMGNYVYAEFNIKFISENKWLLFFFRVAATLMVFFGALASMDVAWALADIIMGLMAIVNLIAIMLLGKKALLVLDDYEKQRKEGKNPVFHSKNVGFTDTDYWNR